MIEEIKTIDGKSICCIETYLRALELKNQELKKELSDLKELILKTINIFEVALELKEVKSK